MVDRLKQLKKGAPVMDEEEVALDVDRGPSTSSGMQQFFNDVEIVKKNILIIRNSTAKVGDINQQVILATSSENEPEEDEELRKLLKDTNKKAKDAKDLLKKMNEETDALEKDPAASQNSELRIRKNLTSTLTRKFVDVMKEYQNAQTKYRTDIKKKVKRQVQIIKPDATAEEIDAVMQSGGGSSELMKAAILKGDAADSIRHAYENVASKYQDVLVLERSVAELHQMFLDFALLTEQQGELLDQIEYQVKAAADYISGGNEELVQSIELQKSVRKKQCCLIGTALIVIIIIVIIIVVTQKAKSSATGS